MCNERSAIEGCLSDVVLYQMDHSGVDCYDADGNVFHEAKGLISYAVQRALLGILPMTLLAYDQNGPVQRYSAALPVTKRQIRGGKYPHRTVWYGAGGAAEHGSAGGSTAALGHGDGSAYRGDPASGGYADLLGNIILLPLAYRFATRKAKYAYYLALVCFWRLYGHFVSSGTALNSICLRRVRCWCWWSLAAAGAVCSSWRLSAAWYGEEMAK